MTINSNQIEKSPSYDRSSAAHLAKNYISSGKEDYSSRKSPARLYNPSSNAATNEIEPSLIYLFRECFREILVLEGSLENIKKELASRSDFTLAGAFNLFTGYS